MRISGLLSFAFILAVLAPGTPARAQEAAFERLPAGSVRPSGWLKAQIVRDVESGFAGHMDALTDRFELETFDSDARDSLDKPKIGAPWWNAETTGNWLEGFIRMAWLSENPEAMARAERYVESILAMQEEDGYLCCYPPHQRYPSPIRGHYGELWAQTCLLRGLLAYHELTGREDVFRAVERAVRLSMVQYGPDRPLWNKAIGRGGHAHSLMFVDLCEELYRHTGDRAYVKFAQFLYDSYNEREDVFEYDVLLRNLADMDQLFNGHGAHVMEHIRVPFFLYYATGDERYRVAVENYMPKTDRHITAAGACIGDEDILQRMASPYIGCEYCTMQELLGSLQSMIQKTGIAEYGDRIETLAFNAAEGARLPDGSAIQYLSTDNQHEATAGRGHGGRFKFSPTHEDVAVCCVPNATKFFAYYVDRLWMKDANDGGPVAIAYGPSILTTDVDGVPVTIRQETGYPFEDTVRFTITPKRAAELTLRFRDPGWSKDTEVDAPQGTRIAREHGYLALTRTWKAGDRVALRFHPDVERHTMPNGEIYWRRGPLVYALEIPVGDRVVTKQYDVEGFADYDVHPAEGGHWNYAVDEGCGGFTFAPRAVTGEANPWKTASVALRGKLLNRETERIETVDLVPFGCTRLRRTAFTDMAPIRMLQSEGNLAQRARVKVSSLAAGHAPEALVDGVAEGWPQNREAEWASKHGTTGEKVVLIWEDPVVVENVWLFDRPNVADHVKNAWINFSDGSSKLVEELPNDASAPYKLNFPEKTITWMEVIITRVGPRTQNSGFSEIAVFREEPELDR
ncbi:DUF7402 domain-containing protein [Kiritimatiella glycovorans]|uniref:Non-reducing end beta-L-arabinofuranosidase n=1 Tax=Kiritimatiella glycovorans TaxID=1307763 RepID=A0A0G3EKT5_9BACT|nr:beta-L-arabinofuranosidase domain-containing protein [Kiritimatiella glycovorans]AKJ65365.1 hypothetical protein L21SP4_02134 [Kiritimatiella glycovorans]